MIVDTGAEKTIMHPDVLTARDYHEEPRQLCGVTGHCMPLRGPVEARLGVGGSEEVLPVYVAEMEDPCLLGIDYLMQVGACIDLKKRKLRIREKETPLSLGVAPAEVVMAERVRIALDTEPKVTFELSGKLENHDRMTESIEPLEQADDSEEVTFQKRLPGNEGVVNDVSLPGHLTDLARRSAIHLDHQQQERLRSTLTRYADVFSKGDLDLGHTGLVQHHIRMGDALPIKHAHRRIIPARREEMQRSMMEMEAQEVVEQSDSPWSSPVVLVTKKDGTKQFCVDYRSLNNVTAKDSYPLLRMDDTLDAMAGAHWFSTLDLKSGYHQVEMAREDKAKTAFSFGQGLWQFTVMPFGLCNAPSCFKRLMEIRGAFLGNIVGRDGVKTDPQKVAAVQDWPVPTCVADVKSFVGLCTYYRRFVKRFAQIASPLHQLTRKGACFEWSATCQVAFDSLKRALVEAPVLPYPDPASPYLLDTDASAEGLGAVLSQVKDEKECVVAYYSAKFTDPEKNYCDLKRTTLKAPLGQLARWLGRLEQYHYEVQHRSGRVHNNADSLSRRPCEPECQHCLRREERVACRQLQVWGDSVDAKERWRQVQREDDDLTPLIKWMEASPERPGWPQVTAESPVTKHLWQQWAMLRLENGVLQRRWDDARGRPSYWVVLVPRTLRRDLLHGGITSSQLGMRRDVQEWCRTCEVCCARNGPVKKNRAPLQLYQVGAPLERVAVDIVGPFPVTKQGNRFICVVMDYFTKWPEAYALPDHEAETVAEALVNNFITCFGVPCELHSDQGREFESVVFQECCRLLGIKKTRNTTTD
ncbi:retrovirus-related Pol polyprotein from transposon 412 [Penaeus vannamei]|uniref:retrovirus-related Pol polyprotein from transposon 412 n=1 Tax=Penaeus vannamei TaxID=6689 RepID=UPI00387F9EBB